MIDISDKAQEHFRKLIADHEEDNVNIRVFVVNPGTPKAECGVSYCPEDAVEDKDQQLKFEGFSVFVDAESAPFLEEASIDFKEEELGTQLTLRAPNAKVKKVDDDAPLAERLSYVLQSEVNPELANHGGMVSLVEITEDNIVVLQFGGGCQGCGMADMTLKEGIEKTLKQHFPEINGVQDVTEHAAGENPYFS